MTRLIPRIGFVLALGFLAGGPAAARPTAAAGLRRQAELRIQRLELTMRLPEAGARTRPADARRIARARRGLNRADRHLDRVDDAIFTMRPLRLGERVRQRHAARLIKRAGRRVARLEAEGVLPRSGGGFARATRFAPDVDEVDDDGFPLRWGPGRASEQDFGPDPDEPDMTGPRRTVPPPRTDYVPFPDEFEDFGPDPDEPDMSGPQRTVPPPNSPAVISALRGLGMGEHATPAQAKSKYRMLMRVNHPDRQSARSPAEQAEAEERAKVFTAARAALQREGFFDGLGR